MPFKPFEKKKGKGKSTSKGRAAFAKKFGKSKGKPPIGESGGPTPQGTDMEVPPGRPF